MQNLYEGEPCSLHWCYKMSHCVWVHRSCHSPLTDFQFEQHILTVFCFLIKCSVSSWLQWCILLSVFICVFFPYLDACIVLENRYHWISVYKFFLFLGHSFAFRCTCYSVFFVSKYYKNLKKCLRTVRTKRISLKEFGNFHIFFIFWNTLSVFILNNQTVTQTLRSYI